jgi:ABC-type dipeptide/oligopeptide/nickel transport system permease component
MLEVIHQDYIRTARAKGCSPFRVIVSHALRNSMIPVVTIFGIEAGYVIGGTVIVETVFSWPGVGQMLLNSILSRDFPLVVGGTLILAVIFVGINIIVDLLYNLIDPRIELKS